MKFLEYKLQTSVLTPNNKNRSCKIRPTSVEDDTQWRHLLDMFEFPLGFHDLEMTCHDLTSVHRVHGCLRHLGN